MVFFAGFLFLLSGAAALAYEVVWVKLLTLQFGSAAWSISTVVASFMAGLGAGGAWAGRRADRIQRPLRAYALLELGIALFGMISVPLLKNIARILDPLYKLTDGYFALFVLLQFLLSFAMLAVPTFLMGASLPLLIVAVSKEEAFRRSVALFYGINTLGAAVGTLVTGFIFLPVLGISAAVWVAVVAGILVAGGAMLLDRRMGPRPASMEHRRSASNAQMPRLLLAALAIAGCLGLCYQIAWTRLLIPVVGSSVYAFTIILTTVLLGHWRRLPAGRNPIISGKLLLEGRGHHHGAGLLFGSRRAVRRKRATLGVHRHGPRHRRPHLASFYVPRYPSGIYCLHPRLLHGGRPAVGHRCVAKRGRIEGMGGWRHVRRQHHRGYCRLRIGGLCVPAVARRDGIDSPRGHPRH